MHLALIPPISALHHITSAFRYQLVLPQLLGNEKYREKYQDLAIDNILILDNGAAEGEIVTNRQLRQLANELHVDELVLPDTIGDALGTISRVKEFLMTEAKRLEYDIDLMLVAQGRSKIEVQRMIEAVLRIDNPSIASIGIPRHLLNTIGRNDVRLDIAKWLHKEYPTLDIHFLGASPAWPYEIHEVGQLGFVRGMDTSMPFNYALHDHILKDDRRMIKRPDNYFDATLTADQEELAKRNVRQMIQWMNGSRGGK